MKSERLRSNQRLLVSCNFLAIANTTAQIQGVISDSIKAEEEKTERNSNHADTHKSCQASIVRKHRQIINKENCNQHQYTYTLHIHTQQVMKRKQEERKLEFKNMDVSSGEHNERYPRILDQQPEIPSEIQWLKTSQSMVYNQYN